MRQIRQFVLLIIIFAFIGIGCITIPDVRPFADSTANLAAAAGSHYQEIASEIASLKPVLIPGEKETDEKYKNRKTQLENTQKLFRETDRNLDKLFNAMVTYSEKLTSLVAAGKSGGEAAQSIFDSVQGFADIANISGLSLGAVATPITKGFKAIADAFTKMEAKKTMKEAIAAAEPGVNMVSEQFETIYKVAITHATNGIRNTKRLEASISAGPNIIGFDSNVKRNYNAYYRHLNRFVTGIDPNTSASAWRGFCQENVNPCQAINELEAVALVEARMEAIRPIVQVYEIKIRKIEGRFAKMSIKIDIFKSNCKTWI